MRPIAVLAGLAVAVLASVAMVLGVSGAAAGAAQGRWVATDLGTLGGPSSNAYIVNDRGQVVGVSRDASGLRHVFLWQNGKMTAIGRLDSTDSSSVMLLLNQQGQVAWQENSGRDGWVRSPDGVIRQLESFTIQAMNDRGQIVGGGVNSQHALLWEKGHIRDLGVLPGYRWSFADAINDSGVVVGTVNHWDAKSKQVRRHAFLWKNGTMRDLGVLPGFADSRAVAVNSSGQVLGVCETLRPADAGWGRMHAVLWDSRGMRDLGPLSGQGWAAYPFSLNDSGLFVGTLGRSTNYTGAGAGATHAFLWRAGKLVDLGTLGGQNSWPSVGIVPSWSMPAAPGSLSFSLNERGQVVGTSNLAMAKPTVGDPGKGHAVLWQQGTITDLGTLGGASSAAAAINNHGQIVGWSGVGGDGRTHAVLWALEPAS